MRMTQQLEIRRLARGEIARDKTVHVLKISFIIFYFKSPEINLLNIFHYHERTWRV